MSRTFTMREHFQFELLAEATNAFNQTNINPNAVNGGVSAILGLPLPRSAEITLRLAVTRL